MLLPEQVSELPICDPHFCNTRKSRNRFWRAAMRGLHFSGLYVATESNPATRLAKLVTTLATAHPDLGSDDPDLFHRLETQLSITEDYEARKLLSAYLSEP